MITVITKMIKRLCPYCNDITSVEQIHAKEGIVVRGDNIEIDSCFLKCSVCHNDFDDPKSDLDVLDCAYREYRKRHDMLQPDDIKNWRKRLDLTQVELSRILGLGDVTINRYESGKLQETSHDKAMKLATKPENMLDLISENPQAIPDDIKRNKIIDLLKKEIDLERSFSSFLNFKFNTYQPSEFSGFKTLNLDKVFAALVFFCDKGVFKTKLNKLMFYADFIAFKISGISITGLEYVKLPYGPVPDNYDHYIANLLSDKKIYKKEEQSGEKLIACNKPDLSIFSEDEIQILIHIKNHFIRLNARQISDVSHKENGYIETKDSALISYRFANDINIRLKISNSDDQNNLNNYN